MYIMSSQCVAYKKIIALTCPHSALFYFSITPMQFSIKVDRYIYIYDSPLCKFGVGVTCSSVLFLSMYTVSIKAYSKYLYEINTAIYGILYGCGSFIIMHIPVYYGLFINYTAWISELMEGQWSDFRLAL